MLENKQPFSKDKYQESPSKGSSLHISWINKLHDHLWSILQQEARLKDFGHMLSTIKFDVLIINIDSTSKDIIAKLKLKGFFFCRTQEICYNFMSNLEVF